MIRPVKKAIFEKAIHFADFLPPPALKSFATIDATNSVPWLSILNWEYAREYWEGDLMAQPNYVTFQNDSKMYILHHSKVFL